MAVLQPLDVIKTVQQASGKSAIEATRHVVKQDGLKGLWLRGLGPTLVRGALGPGIYFQALDMVGTDKSKQTPLVSFIQGAFARTVGAVVISPVTVLKARIEWDPRSGMRFTSVKDMFVGLGHTLVRDVPFSGLYLLFYRGLKGESSSSEKQQPSSKLYVLKGFTNDFVAGLAAGFLATAVTHPFDVFKTRSQLGKPLIMNTSLKDIFSGLTLRLAKRPLSMALTWALFELVSSCTEQKGNVQSVKNC